MCTLRYTDFSVRIKSIEFSVRMDSCCMSIAKLNVLFDQNGKNSVINFKVSGNRLLWSVFSCLFYPKLKAINIPQETGTLDKR